MSIAKVTKRTKKPLSAQASKYVDSKAFYGALVDATVAALDGIDVWDPDLSERLENAFERSGSPEAPDDVTVSTLVSLCVENERVKQQLRKLIKKISGELVDASRGE